MGQKIFRLRPFHYNICTYIEEILNNGGISIRYNYAIVIWYTVAHLELGHDVSTSRSRSSVHRCTTSKLEPLLTFQGKNRDSCDWFPAILKEIGPELGVSRLRGGVMPRSRLRFRFERWYKPALSAASIPDHMADG